MDSVVVNGKEIQLPANAKNAIIDTGTTLVGEWKTGCGRSDDEVLIFLAVMKAVRRRCWTYCLLA